MPTRLTPPRRRALALLAATSLPLAAACGTSSSHRVMAAATPILVEEGLASWYGYPYHGQPTASGETYDMQNLTAAHRSLPFGTTVRVVSLVSRRSVVVTINDRGPFIEGRIIDLSRRAAEALDAVRVGVIPVRLEVLTLGDEMVAAKCWEVQVGAFGDAANVERAVARLRQQGLPPRTIPAAGGLTRVRVAVNESRLRADAVAARLQGDFPGAAVVPCGLLP